MVNYELDLETTDTFTTVGVPFTVFCVMRRISPSVMLEKPVFVIVELVLADVPDFVEVPVLVDAEDWVVAVPPAAPVGAPPVGGVPPPCSPDPLVVPLAPEATCLALESVRPTGISSVLLSPVSVKSEEEELALSACVPMASTT